MLFVIGSAAGATLAWLVGRRQWSRSTVVVLTGVVGGLLGILMSATWDTAAPATEAGIGFLGTMAPLTLCMTTVRPIATRAEIPSAARHFAATLALALVYGISGATLGFVAVEFIRLISVKENEGISMGYPSTLSLQPCSASSAASPHCL